MSTVKIVSIDENNTQELAKKIIRQLHAGDVVLLTGDLGAGKTTFVAGALHALGYKEHVVSPTFNILKCYFDVSPNIFHIDAYRLEDQSNDIGLEEFIEGNGITFIEWPIYIPELIPEKHLSISITRLSDNEREIIVSSEDNSFNDLIEGLKK